MDDAEPRAPASLATKLGVAARASFATWRAREAGRVAPAHEWRIAAAVAALLAVAPVATIVGADLLAGRARTQAKQLAAQAAPRVAADQAAARDRADLAAIVRRPGIGAVVESLARALPAEASLARAGRDRDGLLEIEVATADPDQLREALRREPMLAALRDAGQRQGDANLVVALRERAQ